jgi:TPR repeat protein
VEKAWRIMLRKGCGRPPRPPLARFPLPAVWRSGGTRWLIRACPCDLAASARWCSVTYTRDLVAALILAVGCAGSAVGGPFEDGAAAIERGDYVTAMRLLRPLADQGVAKSQGMVGAMYEKGVGVPQDYAAAMSWYRRTADQGHALAQTSLGAMYALGEGVPQDYGEAIKWFRKAADQGEPHAEMRLGAAYENGFGVPQDSATAASWFRKAADQGYPIAQVLLGDMYALGRGVPQDYVSAHLWFNLAAAGGDKDAAESRDKVAKEMTPAQIAEAQKLAREWKPARQPTR